MENQKKLSKLQDVNSDDIQEISLQMKEYVKNESDTVLQVIADKVNNRPGLLGILFPNSVQREQSKLTVQKMQNLFKSQDALLKAYTDSQIELAKKQADAFITSEVMKYEGELKRRAMIIQEDLTGQAQSGINEMTSVFAVSRETYMEKRNKQLQTAEKYKNDEYGYKAFIKSLNNELDVFMSTIDKLLGGFINALEKKANSLKD